MANRILKEAIARMKETYPDDDGLEVRLGEEVAALVAEYDEWQRIESEAKDQKDAYMLRLMGLLGTHKKGKAGNWVVSWVTVLRKEFVQPESKFRRFSVRGIPE